MATIADHNKLMIYVQRKQKTSTIAWNQSTYVHENKKQTNKIQWTISKAALFVENAIPGGYSQNG